MNSFRHFYMAMPIVGFPYVKGYSISNRKDIKLGWFFYCQVTIYTYCRIFARKSTLKSLNAKFGVPTVNKPPPLPVAATLVAKHVFQDFAAQNGPSTIQQTIRQADGAFIPRFISCLSESNLVLTDFHNTGILCAPSCKMFFLMGQKCVIQEKRIQDQGGD